MVIVMYHDDDPLDSLLMGACFASEIPILPT